VPAEAQTHTSVCSTCVFPTHTGTCTNPRETVCPRHISVNFTSLFGGSPFRGCKEAGRNEHGADTIASSIFITINYPPSRLLRNPRILNNNSGLIKCSFANNYGRCAVDKDELRETVSRQSHMHQYRRNGIFHLSSALDRGITERVRGDNIL